MMKAAIVVCILLRIGQDEHTYNEGIQAEFETMQECQAYSRQKEFMPVPNDEDLAWVYLCEYRPK